MTISASSGRGAAKLFGLFLLHCGLLKPLGCTPCCVSVKKANDDEYYVGQCFKLWNAKNQIYTECYIPPKKVGMESMNQVLCKHKVLIQTRNFIMFKGFEKLVTGWNKIIMYAFDGLFHLKFML